MAKLSIVVPVYNSEQFLQQCITSILAQSLFDIELILVDDGSTDASGKICDAEADSDSRVKVLHQDHKGPIYARQSGVMASCAEYVTFVDSDDFIEENAYEYAIPAINDLVDVVAFGLTRYVNEQKQKSEFGPFPAKRYNRAEIVREIYPCMVWTKRDTFGMDPSLWSKIIKRQLLLDAYDLIKDKKFHYGEDVAIVYPVMKKAYSLEIIHYSYYNHRQYKTRQEKSYLTDPCFFDKLYILYKHLTKVFEKDDEIREQIDDFYIHSVNLKRHLYKPQNSIEYIFPFNRVKQNEHIVLYGAGNVGQSYYAQLLQLSYCPVVLWVDRDYARYTDQGVVSPEQIMSISFDKIVVAIKSLYAQEVIKNDLLDRGVDEHKIVFMRS